MTDPFHSLRIIQAQNLNETHLQLIEVLRQITPSVEHLNMICKYLDRNPTLIENLQRQFVSEPEYTRWFQRVANEVGLLSQDLPYCLQNLTILERRRQQDKMIDDARRRRRHNIINEFAKQLLDKYV